MKFQLLAIIAFALFITSCSKLKRRNWQCTTVVTENIGGQITIGTSTFTLYNVTEDQMNQAIQQAQMNAYGQGASIQSHTTCN